MGNNGNACHTSDVTNMSAAKDLVVPWNKEGQRTGEKKDMFGNLFFWQLTFHNKPFGSAFRQ